MTAPLIVGVDSGLDGAFCWMRGGKVLHTLLTRSIVTDGRIDTVGLEAAHNAARAKCEPWGPFVAYLEEPFNAAIKGGSYSSGYTDQCKRWGRLQGWLESWGYEVRGVQAKTWQRELLDLARFEVRTEKECAPRLAKGWELIRPRIGTTWRLRRPDKTEDCAFGASRLQAIMDAQHRNPDAVVHTKPVLSHDTKAASVAYVREHFPGVELVPPRSKKPHDGLADAVCIAAWASKKET